MRESEQAPDGIDTGVPSVARMYDYYLGGNDNFAVDREAAEKIIALMPAAREAARANRAFLGRAVRFMVAHGVRQFLDIGAGLPTRENVHEVALDAAPDSRVVYVDNDPIVLLHARALLVDDQRATVVQADLREPAKIIDNPEVRAAIDFDRPVGLLLLAILHFVPGDREARSIMAALREPLAPGSMLALSHGYASPSDAASAVAGSAVYARTTTGGITTRSPEQIDALMEGFDPVDPGLVPVESWQTSVTPDFGKPGLLGVVARLGQPGNRM
ncbi:SAM-dependent methyltransferase [Acrocarpospora catenulata]|uniref:SAM-dependent methyltransferase n=1 Tax=Acrocarpospora catenulata TaxID=2836182 RepID=UPI001BDA6FA6|nr:SAM-dependent methyltransferase [Acrocarpospora catenulata]